uniref:Retrovirus-related Pol polyprotein from transposon TNT 1-94-like beta-barrel domain-containing protein n=2 Tax=Nicotiana TaxID=4085 RepID=A0A1S3XUE3_TOBAC|nr:PREDICTED: uncharacterized protein LOC104221671 [Nicotiana sylvestris]XP_016443499.1 PREDICTED: uncharacterized protein LOC107768859 [Nicotiana tabacum]
MTALKANLVQSSNNNNKRYRAGNDKGKTNTPKANLAEGGDIIATAISQVNIVAHAKEWVIDYGATRHICANREAFSSYTPVEDDREVVYLGDSSTTKVLDKGKVLLKLTSEKTLALVDGCRCEGAPQKRMSRSEKESAGADWPFLLISPFFGDFWSFLRGAIMS